MCRYDSLINIKPSGPDNIIAIVLPSFFSLALKVKEQMLRSTSKISPLICQFSQAQARRNKAPTNHANKYKTLLSGMHQVMRNGTTPFSRRCMRQKQTSHYQRRKRKRSENRRQINLLIMAWHDTGRSLSFTKHDTESQGKTTRP